MSDTVIRVENLGKKYVLNHLQQSNGDYKVLREVITDAAKSIGKKILKPSSKKILNPAREEFWALKDVSFEIKQGDRIGIIGRNGAGKSTLLKILSRIVEPTAGKISVRGQVASLLEVGTGFHPELTGKENIFLNGAILGMSRAEIKRKFDEIIDFAEIEKFLDTPVKRYSSGMYVRLAFAVAAHLDPEILIVDEVLAVGDAQFQKKCLGKMQDVSKDGSRTVLFVSHNMDAIQRLCPQCIMLERGRLIEQGDTNSIVVRYMSNHFVKASPNQWIDVSQINRTGTGEAYFTRMKYSSLNEAAAFHPYSNGTLEFLLAIESDSIKQIGSLAVPIYDKFGTKLINTDSLSLGEIITLQKGENLVKITIQKLYLKPGTYVIGLWLADPLINKVFDYADSVFEFEVVNLQADGLGSKPYDDGVVTSHFELSQVT